jgi:PBP1b-binding outer membrane lipoprotein LpoB
MRRFQALLIIVALFLSGCVIRGKQQAKVIAPPPVPAAPAPPPQPPQPLSIPQTQTYLPPPQPISPEALATIQSAAGTTETQPNSENPPRAPRPAGPVVGRRNEPAAPPAAPQPAATAAPPPNPAETEPRGEVQEIVSAAELKQLQDSVAARKSEIHKVLELSEKHRLSREEASVVARIKSFLQQSDDAEKRGDWRQADALAQTAQVLAKELSSGNQ